MNIMVIYGSTRGGRAGDKAAKWAHDYVAAQDGLKVDYVDVKDLGLPFFDEAGPIGSFKEFRHGEGKEWNERLEKADAFIFITPEYNHSIPASLKNAIDYAWGGWNFKPFTAVSYSSGPWGGVRALEQLALIGIGVKLLPIKTTVSIPFIQDAFDETGKPVNSHLESGLKAALDELLMLASKLKD